MSDTSYKIEIDIATRGDLDAKLGSIGKGASAAEGKISGVGAAFERLAGTARHAGSAIMAPFDAVAHKAIEVGSSLAKIGIAGGAGMAALGVHQNAQLESLQLSLAAMMNANELSNGIFDGMSRAGGVMKDMRKDAAALPGEFQDLAQIMRTAMLPAAHLGMNIDQIRGMSSKIMAAGAVAGLPMDQVAREAAMMLEGRVGVHNILATRLGLGGSGSKEFHALSNEKRVEAITGALDKFAPSIELFKTSFDGLSSTFVDNTKRFLGVATEPLFGKVKDALKQANAWYDANEAYVNAEAQAIGSKLAYWFDIGKEKIQEWWPAIETFARNAASAISDLLTQIKPYADEYGPMLKDWLQNPNSINQIKTAAELYGGAKVGGSILGGAADVGIGAMTWVQTLKMLGMGTSGVATAGATTAVGAAAAPIGTGAAGSAGLLGTAAAGGFGAEASAAAGAGLLATATAAAAVTAALAGVGAAAWQGWELYKDIQHDQEATRNNWAEVAFRSMDKLKGFDATNEEYQRAFSKLSAAGDETGLHLLELGSAALDAAASLRSAASKATESNKFIGSEWMGIVTQGVMQMNADKLSGKLTEQQKGKALKHGGGGGTHVAKVEIVVTSNQDPSRIARSVLSEIENIRRHPKVSRDVRDWSAP